jgi:hypothetical protein
VKAKPKPLRKRKLAVLVAAGDGDEPAAKRHEAVFSNEGDCETAAELVAKLNSVASKFELSVEEL